MQTVITKEEKKIKIEKVIIIGDSRICAYIREKSLVNTISRQLNSVPSKFHLGCLPDLLQVTVVTRTASNTILLELFGPLNLMGHFIKTPLKHIS